MNTENRSKAERNSHLENIVFVSSRYKVDDFDYELMFRSVVDYEREILTDRSGGG